MEHKLDDSNGPHDPKDEALNAAVREALAKYGVNFEKDGYVLVVQSGEPEKNKSVRHTILSNLTDAGTLLVLENALENFVEAKMQEFKKALIKTFFPDQEPPRASH